jgi:Flp pilus assembly protein TadG
MRLAHRPAARRGAAAVEFAAVGSLFFLLVLGIFETGRLLMAQHLLTCAARQACRAGVLPGKSSDAVAAVAKGALAAEGVQGSAATVLVNGGSGDASSAQSGDNITVITTASAATVTWLPGANYYVGTLTGQYTLRRE